MTINNGWRTQPMYSLAEAAHLAHVSSSTVRNWLLGYKGKDIDIQPLFPSRSNQEPRVSFLELVEIVVAAKFRTAERVTYQRVLLAYESAQKMFELEYPFAHKKLETFGGRIANQIHDPGLVQSRFDFHKPELRTTPGLVLEIVQQIDYDGDLAARWFPIGKSLPIVVDPRVSTGIPTIVGRGVTVQTIHKRWKAGLKIDFIASDLALEPEVVETALQYAEQVAA